MTENTVFTIHGILRTTTPLHISSPTKAYYEVATGDVKFGDPAKDKQGIFPLVLVQTLGYPGCGKDGTTAYVPMIAANNIVGRLRRHAAYIIGEHLIKRSEQLSIGAFNALQCGAATGVPDKDPTTYAQYKASREHLYLGTFGGGPKMFKRHLKVYNLVPETVDTAGFGLPFEHPHDARPQVYQLSDLIKGVMENRVDDLERLSKPEFAASLVVNFEVSLAERQKLISEQRRKRNGQAEDDTKQGRESVRAVPCHQYVPPNVEFPFVFELEGDEAKLGFLLKILERFASTDTIGGRSRNGYGHFALQDVSLTGVDAGTGEPMFEPIGNLFNNNRLVTNDTFVVNSVIAYEEALSQLTAGDFENLLFGEKKAA